MDRNFTCSTELTPLGMRISHSSMSFSLFTASHSNSPNSPSQSMSSASSGGSYAQWGSSEFRLFSDSISSDCKSFAFFRLLLLLLFLTSIGMMFGSGEEEDDESIQMTELVQCFVWQQPWIQTWSTPNWYIDNNTYLFWSLFLLYPQLVAWKPSMGLSTHKCDRGWLRAGSGKGISRTIVNDTNTQYNASPRAEYSS